jgi:hypothetical protein
MEYAPPPTRRLIPIALVVLSLVFGSSLSAQKVKDPSGKDPDVSAASVTGSVLTVQGNDFGTTATVSIGTSTVPAVVNAAGTSMTATVPAGTTPGSHALVVNRLPPKAGTASASRSSISTMASKTNFSGLNPTLAVVLPAGQQ